jgi:hypothetical protein
MRWVDPSHYHHGYADRPFYENRTAKANLEHSRSLETKPVRTKKGNL